MATQSLDEFYDTVKPDPDAVAELLARDGKIDPRILSSDAEARAEVVRERDPLKIKVLLHDANPVVVKARRELIWFEDRLMPSPSTRPAYLVAKEEPELLDVLINDPDEDVRMSVLWCGRNEDMRALVAQKDDAYWMWHNIAEHTTDTELFDMAVNKAIDELNRGIDYDCDTIMFYVVENNLLADTQIARIVTRVKSQENLNKIYDALNSTHSGYRETVIKALLSKGDLEQPEKLFIIEHGPSHLAAKFIYDDDPEIRSIARERTGGEM